MKRVLLIPILLAALSVSSFAEFPASDVYEKTSKVVVLIVGFGEGSNSMIGSGAIVGHHGTIVTNAHVVMNKAASSPYSKIKVYTKPDKVTGSLQEDLKQAFIAKVVAYDVDLDLAVLKAEGMPEDMGSITFANSDEIKIGEEVVAIGHPEQGGLWTLSYGRISGEILNQNNVQGKDVFQTDTSMNRGNSGGPLLDSRGYLVGINTSIARIGEGNVPIVGVNFAIKSSVVKKWFDKQGIFIAYGKDSLHDQTQQVAGKNEKIKAQPDMAKEIKSNHVTEEPKILTPKKPYKQDDLLKEVEKELEDMMEEMRGKIRK